MGILQLAGKPSASSDVSSLPVPGRLGPVLHRARWIAGGLGCQLVGVAGPIAYVVAKTKRESISGLITTATVRLAWHESLHARAGAAVLAAGAILFAIGSVLLARPYARRRSTLLVAVPVAAVCGAVFLGVAALVVAVVILLSAIGGGGAGSSDKSPSEGSRTRDPSGI